MIEEILKRLLKQKIKRKFPTLEMRGLSTIHFLERATIGNYCFINSNCNFNCEGGLKIGDNVIFGQEVMIQTSKHNFNGKFIPYDEHQILKPVIIENNVWIGSRAIILPGVRIGEGAIVGAGSIVTKDINSLAIVVGNPAKQINERDKLNYEKLKNQKAFYQKHIFYRRTRK